MLKFFKRFFLIVLGLLAVLILFLVGSVVAAFFPRRSWRWALAGFVAFGLSDLVNLGNRPHLPELDLHWWLSHLAGGAPIWAVHALPILVGAYLGARLSTSQGAT